MYKAMINSNISTLYAENDIAFIKLSNGPKNLLTEPEFIDRKILTEWLESNKEIKALIITGEGRHFSHGADVSLFSDSSCSDNITEKLENAKKLLDTIENLPIVTVAAINGGCFGGGLETALSCQFRICSPKAFLGLPEITHGVIPGMAGIERLAKLIGKEKTVSMCLSGEILSAQKALEYNLVSSVTAQKDALPEAIEFTKEIIAGKSKLQIECIIDTINQTLNGIPNASKGKFETVLKQH